MTAPAAVRPTALIRSATFRLALGIALAIAVANGVIFAGVYWFAAREVAARTEALVRADLTGLADLYAQRRLIALREAIETRLERDPTVAAVYLLTDKRDGRLAGNLARWPDGVPTGERLGRFTASADGRPPGDYWGAGTTLPGGFRLVIGHALAEDDTHLARLALILIGASAATLALGIGGGVLASRRLFARILAVNEVAAAVEAGTMAARVAGADRPDEFGDLARHVNAMLERTERLIGGLREVSDRIAHELRTPLNRIRGRIDLIADAGSETERAAAAEAARTEVADTVRVFEALLDIATTEAEAGNRAGLAPVDLAAVVADVADLYEAVAEDRGIVLTVAAAGPVPVLGDRMLLARMLANVVDNAVKFSPPEAGVTIALTVAEDLAVLSVTDRGPGLDPAFRKRAFDRFTRGADTAEVPGHGLGLSLVRAIAIRHGARIELTDAEPGLTVTFRLPLGSAT
ncbi:hypothetical protein ABB55_00855 [Prosthecomicrobium hirschii]|uniref:histidine kinase n=1 Tax=Prosthecodimorpha hirschii TaxID=665126 RepID=A0A0P6VG00_9HYPH|nr:HAMP domain-containing sensor histidine kinase [Prosthecomicrobium hirschii]KPL50951.1 hypothetical protein ABB55_00855 [Prosthecomicrobium hirschii]